jgi:hypothetical protein
VTGLGLLTRRRADITPRPVTRRAAPPRRGKACEELGPGSVLRRRSQATSAAINGKPRRRGSLSGEGDSRS